LKDEVHKRSISIIDTNGVNLEKIDEGFMQTKEYIRATPRSKKKYIKYINKNK
jgi:hypothetical protein